jgi:branched-chain amino acid transport system permease protein
MLAEFLQFLFSGLTVGATYALAALGFTLIYNASNVINFAQGEFIMLGGMLAVFFTVSGFPLPIALALAILVPAIVGVLVEKLAIEPVKGAETVTLIIITIGASLVIRGLVQILLGKGTFAGVFWRRTTPDFGRHAHAPKSVGVWHHGDCGGFSLVFLQPHAGG